ncbi:MAG TPA: hypothetical protein VJM78_01120 [Rhizomicrobium sp.]|nr:hypothetical protein [Rhizomicrobium sp.]
MKRIALALLLLALPSAAQEVEQVTVYGGSLSGFWRSESPGWFRMSMFGDVTWGPLRQAWCRRDHDVDGYASHCFAGSVKGGGLEQDGRRFHLAWGSALMRFAYDGEATSPTSIEGHYAIKLMGITVTNPALAHGTKFVPRPDAPDEAGKAQVVRSVLNGEAVAHDAALDADIAAARGLKLGAIQSISFLGRQVMPGKDGPKTVPDPNYLAAYAVEYADGERICWLHQDDDGKLAAFRCR